MKEFDLKKYLAEGRLLKEEEKEVSDKARREAEEEGYEDGYNDAVEDAKDALDKIKDETEEEKDKKKGVKEEMKDKSMEDDTMKEEMDDTINPGNTKDDQAKKDAYDYDARPAHMKEEEMKSMEDDVKEEMKDKKEKLTKEGLRNLIKEKITSILTEDEEVEDNVDVNVEKDVDVNVKDKEEVDVDKESEESDIEVKSELPGESSDTSAVLGLLTKAQEEAEGMNDEVLMDQIGNTITYFTRKHVVKASNEKLEEEVNELFGFGSDVDKGQRLGIGTDRGGLGFTKIGRGTYKLTDPTSHPSFRQGEIWKPKQDEKKLYVGQSLPRLGDIEGLSVGRESKDKVKT